jgi:hypothetical protein
MQMLYVTQKRYAPYRQPHPPALLQNMEGSLVDENSELLHIEKQKNEAEMFGAETPKESNINNPG